MTKVSIVVPYPVFEAAEDYAAILACGACRTARVTVAFVHVEGWLPAPVVRSLDAAGVERLALPQSDMRDIRLLRRALRALRTDVVHVNQEFLPGMAAGGLLGRAPLVVTAHNPALRVRLSPRGRLLRRLASPRVDAWIVLSGRNARLLAARLGPGHPSADDLDSWSKRSQTPLVRVIAPGLPPDRFARQLSRSAARRALGLPADGFIVGTVGRLARQKRHDVLIRGAVQAAVSIPNLSVVIVGEGELSDDTRSLADELLPGRVAFPGHLIDVPSLLPALDVFALPSDFEGLSFAMLEAMATGLPIVASDVQGSGEAITDLEDGLLVEAGSAAALADRLVRLWRDGAFARRLGDAAQAKFHAFYTSDRMIEDTLALYNELLLA